MKHVVQYSGGVCSFCAAERVVKKFGVASVTLLFADTLMEDWDNYRFLIEGAAHLAKLPRPDALLARCAQLPPLAEPALRKQALLQLAQDAMAAIPLLTWITEGRNIYEVFRDERFLGNTRVDPCSRILKREFLNRWCEQHAPDAIRYFGLDWTELERFERLQARFLEKGIQLDKIQAPMLWKPLVDKPDMLVRVAKLMPVPRMYGEGYAHANCSGMCIKSGQAQFRLLLETRPEEYAYHEGEEAGLRQFLAKDVAILRDRRGGETKPLTLEDFRKRIEAGTEHDRHDWGGCGCAID